MSAFLHIGRCSHCYTEQLSATIRLVNRKQAVSCSFCKAPLRPQGYLDRFDRAAAQARGQALRASKSTPEQDKALRHLRKTYTPRCLQCQSQLDSGSQRRCEGCRWIACPSCGYCGCGRNRARAQSLRRRTR